ncbi:unnamed protein product [Symbiodinium sp. CCMP2592]|nr:unnamed protein product [Symbiodinium sp. CCMP2592]
MDLDESDEEVPEPARKCRRPTLTMPTVQRTLRSTFLTTDEEAAQEEERQGSVCSALSLYAPQAQAPGICLHLPPDMDEMEHKFTLCAVEQAAADYLHRRWVTFEQLDALLDTMPTTSACRNASVALPQSADQRIVTFGAYQQGPLAGLRTPTHRFPMATCLLNTVVHTMAGRHPRTTLFLARNMASGLHTDNNQQGVNNLLIPLSNFEGGHLFVEDNAGDYLLDSGGPRGQVLPVTLPYLSFDASRRHLVLPWTGRRLILGTYHIRDADKLSANSALYLKYSGFEAAPADADLLAWPDQCPCPLAQAKLTLQRCLSVNASAAFLMRRRAQDH